MRFRFQDKPCGSICRDGKEEQFIAELESGPIRDDGEAREKAKAIIETARQQLEALGFELTLTADEILTPIQAFSKASDKRWNLGKAADVDTTGMNPIQQFRANSDRRWGIGIAS